MTVTEGRAAGGPAAEWTAVERWETVIGLEVHCELQTASKLFCGCANQFGEEPNTNVCPVCLGLPGSLPVLNRQAVELAMRIGAALHCRVERSSFHRKNYFYPDMPKDYQISQYDEPINVDGWLELPGGNRVRVERAHLEEDTGKTTHVGAGGRIHDADHALVDYNRSGVPLVEIVSAPDMRSAEEARAYAAELRGILVASGASDGRMEEGSMRVDANVSVRPVGSDVLATRCEIKNLNSLRSLGRAVEHEARRHIAAYLAGERVAQETRHWDESSGRTISLRSKEEAYDYRYFPEPDLVPLDPDANWRDAVRQALPPMPAARRTALLGHLGTASAAQVDQVRAVVDQDLDGLVTAAVEAGAPPALAVARAANEVAADRDGARRLAAAGFSELCRMEDAGTLSATQAKAVLAEMLAGDGRGPVAIAEAKGYRAMTTDALGSVVDEVLGAHPREWARFVEGEDKLAGFFTGKIMGATQGQADGKAVAAELRRRRG